MSYNQNPIGTAIDAVQYKRQPAMARINMAGAAANQNYELIRGLWVPLPHAARCATISREKHRVLPNLFHQMSAQTAQQ